MTCTSVSALGLTLPYTLMTQRSGGKSSLLKTMLFSRTTSMCLLRWSVLNKMNFHPDKCHVVKVTLKRDKCVDFTLYRLGITDLEYVSVEKDLGVRVTPNLAWQKQSVSLISSARSRLGLTKRTCHFIKNRKHLNYQNKHRGQVTWVLRLF